MKFAYRPWMYLSVLVAAEMLYIVGYSEISEFVPRWWPGALAIAVFICADFVITVRPMVSVRHYAKVMATLLCTAYAAMTLPFVSDALLGALGGVLQCMIDALCVIVALLIFVDGADRFGRVRTALAALPHVIRRRVPVAATAASPVVERPLS